MKTTSLLAFALALALSPVTACVAPSSDVSPQQASAIHADLEAEARAALDPKTRASLAPDLLKYMMSDCGNPYHVYSITDENNHDYGPGTCVFCSSSQIYCTTLVCNNGYAYSHGC